VVMEIARLEHLGDRARSVLGIGHLVDRLVTLGIERLPERIDPADAVLIERGEQPALGRGDAAQQPQGGLVHGLFCRHALDRAA
jgi:hypothetical protein